MYILAIILEEEAISIEEKRYSKGSREIRNLYINSNIFSLE